MKIKRYQKFLEEISIFDNPAIPGEGQGKDKESSYLSDELKKRKEDVGLTGAQSVSELGMRLSSLSNSAKEYIKDTETKKKLVELTKKVLNKYYGRIISKFNMELDIDFIAPTQVPEFMEEMNNRRNYEAEEDFIQDEGEELEDELSDLLSGQDVKMSEEEPTESDIETHKRKIANLLIQGEAKNIKTIYHTQEVKDGLQKIYGDKWKTVFDIWDEMTKIADKLDLLMPPSDRAKQMTSNASGFAGASTIDWKEIESEETESGTEQPEEDFSDFGDEIDLESMFDDEGSWGEEEVEKKSKNWQPILVARGADFPMLLHESIKGLWEFLSLGGIPSDKELAIKVTSETGMMDEPEDWKFGPLIAVTFRKFVNENSKVNDYENVKEELFKVLIDKETMSTEEFMRIFKGILIDIKKSEDKLKKLVSSNKMTQSEADDKLREFKRLKANARRKVDQLIDQIVEDIEAWERYYDELEEYNKAMQQYEKDLEEYNKKMKDYEEQQKGQNVQAQKEEELDYSNMSRLNVVQLKELLKILLEDEEFEKAAKVRDEINKRK
jgi:hypothetical protein